MYKVFRKPKLYGVIRKWEGLDSCIIGCTQILHKFTEPHRHWKYVRTIVYDGNLVAAHYKEKGMSDDDAYEFVWENFKPSSEPGFPILVWKYRLGDEQQY